MYNISTKILFTLIFLFSNIWCYSQMSSQETNNSQRKIEKGTDSKLPVNFDLLELKALRSKYSKHFINQDGGMKMITSSGPIHYNVNGEWKEIGYSIKPNNTGEFPTHPYMNDENSFSTYYPANPVSGKIITKLKEGIMQEQIVSVYAENQSGQNVFQYTELGQPNLEIGNTSLSYTNLFSNADIRYSQTSEGRKLDIIIKNAQFFSQIPIGSKYLVIKEKLTIPSNWQIKEDGKSLDIYQGSNWLANFPQPIAVENYINNPASMDADFSKDAEIELKKIGNEIFLFTKYSINWLTNSNRFFPINLDPVVNYYPCATCGATDTMTTGRMTSASGAKTTGALRLANTGTGIAWARFDVSTLPSGATISSANYYGYHYSGTGGADKIAKIIGMQNIDPKASNNSAINLQITTNGPTYSSTFVFGGSVAGWHMGSLNSQALSDIAAQAPVQGWTALGFNYFSGNTGTMFSYGYEAAIASNKPYLEINYTTVGCSSVTGGTALSSVVLACGDPFTLNLSGNSSGTGTTYQWQWSPPGANTWTNLGAAQSSPFYSTSQSTATDYRCIVTCTTSSLSDSSTVVAVGQNTVLNCYCIPSGAASSANYIANFSTSGASINIANPNNTYTTAPTPGYGNYTNMVVSAIPGSSVGISITFASGSHACGVWVDWNQDGDFNDAGENPLTTGTALTASPYTGSFTVPLTALAGNTRLRIRTAAVSGPVSACGVNTNGEAEDYTINVLGPCTSAIAGTISPASYTICPMTTQALTATLPALQLGLSYQWKVSSVSGGPYTNVSAGTGATSLNYTTEPLPAGTYYYVMETTCANCGPCSTLSNEISILSQDVPAPTATNSAQCAPGVPTAFVTSNAGAIGTGNFNWYNAATGGTLLQSKPFGPLVPYYFNDFTTATLGNASITGNTSVSSGSLLLFPNTTSQYGAITVNAPGFAWDKMKAEFDMTTSGVLANMADGVSFSFGNDVVSTAEATMNAENGTGTKVKLAFVAYTNGTSTQGIYLMYNSSVNEPTPTSTGVLAYSTDVSWKNTTKHIIFNIDSLGKASLTVGGVNIFTNVQLPATYLNSTTVATRPNWKVVMKGRTGSLSMGANIDNLDIKLSTQVTGSPTYLSSVSTTTTFYVAELGTNGCFSPRTPVTVTVNTPPTLNVTPIPNDSVCTGAPVTLHAGGAVNYLWNGNPTSVNGDTTFAQAVAGTYTVTGTDGNGCTNTTSIFIYLHPVVSGTASASPGSICLGASTNLSATATPICTGLYENTFVGYYTPSLWTLVNNTSNGTYDYTGAPANVKLYTGTLASQPGGGSTSISRTITCAGNVSFNWSFNSPIDAYADFPQYSVNGGSPVPFPTYNMSLFGVTQTGSVTIPVSPGDVVTIEVVTIDNDALPGLLTITNFAAPAPMIGGTIKFWDAPVGGTDLGTPPLTVTPSGAGNISYYAEFTTTTTACPNLVRVPATVTVHALPTATLSGGGSVCSGSTLPDVLINLTGTSPWTFTYSDGTNSTTVTGAVTNPYVISGAAPGTYSLLSVNDANCTGSVSSGTVSVTVLPLPTATLSGGGTVCTGATLPDVSVALTGTSPWNLSYFDGSNTQNITGITTNPYIISGALGSYSVMNITDAACTGTFSGSATVANYPVPSVGASITPASVCYGSSAIPAGSGAVTYSWTGGLSDNTPFVASTSDTYTVTGTDNNGCTASASASITVSTQSNILSQSASGNSVSVTGSQNSTNNQADGTTVVYSDPSCDLIATVADLPGGNTLGTTVSTVTVEPTVLTYNSQPYTRRWFSITPTNNSGVNANVTIYQTQGDFDDYNAANGTYPDLPTGPLDATGISNVAVTKVSGGSLGIGMGVIIPNTVVWNATTNLWEISFTVTGTFSEFYVHAVNPLGGALPVELISFYGVQESASDRLEWQTAAESHNAGFEVEHSADGVHFTTVCQLGSLALNGNSSTKLEYQCVYDQPVQGHNYYRLIQIDMDGHRSVYQKVLDLYRKGEMNAFSIYPNPVSDQLQVALQLDQASAVRMVIRDMSGRTLYTSEASGDMGLNSYRMDVSHLSQGMYTIEVQSGSRVLGVQSFSK